MQCKNNANNSNNLDSKIVELSMSYETMCILAVKISQLIK